MAAPIAVRCRPREAPAMLQALVSGGSEGLVLVRDTVACEGRSLLRAFAAAAAQRAERVLVVLFETPRERFEAGLSPAVRQRLQFLDGFSDPLSWAGPAPELRAEDFGEGALGAGGAAGGPLTLLLDSLSWLLLRLPPPGLCQALGTMLRGGHRAGVSPSRVVALLHEELHPPGLLGALQAMATAQLLLRGQLSPGGGQAEEGTPRLITILGDPRKGRGSRKDEIFTLLPDGSLGGVLCVPHPPQTEGGTRPPGSPPDPGPGPDPSPPHTVTFRLGLSEAERAARAALPPPYQLSPPRQSLLLQTPGTFPCPPAPTQEEDFEDPDDDLDV